MSTKFDRSLSHRIRLRGPWDFTWLSPQAEAAAVEPHGTIRLPTTWKDAFGAAIGTIRLSRRFNRPTGIDEGERVWLELEVSCRSSVALNDIPLGQIEPGISRFDATGRMTLHSRIELVIDRAELVDDEQSIAEVALVIESGE